MVFIMKRFVLLALVLSLLLCATSCALKTRQEEMIDFLGKPESEQFWTHGEFQDHADFGIYYYPSLNIKKSKDFSQVSPADIETLGLFVDNYEQWIAAVESNDPEDELVVNYAFDRGLIDTQDHFYIYTKYEDHPLHHYDVWFFDSQTKTLYYFHANI